MRTGSVIVSVKCSATQAQAVRRAGVCSQTALKNDEWVAEFNGPKQDTALRQIAVGCAQAETFFQSKNAADLISAQRDSQSSYAVKDAASQQARNGSVRFRPGACQTRRRLQPVCIRARHTAGHTSAHAAYKGSYLFSCENQKDAGRKAAIKASSQFQRQSLTATPDCVNLKISQNDHWVR